MKKIKEGLYWIAVLISYLVAFTLFGMIVVFLLRMPVDSMFSGFAAWSILICCMLFGAEEETLDMIKDFIRGNRK